MPRTFSNTAAGGSCCCKVLSIARNGRAASARNPLLQTYGLHGKPYTYKSCWGTWAWARRKMSG
eukprot:11196013-Lingulodinium_polyedra.AAC.1